MVTIVKKGASPETMEKALKKFKSKRAMHAKKHNGVIRLKESPAEIQKRMRDEW